MYYLNAMFTAYKYRMYPSESQKDLLEKHFGSCRFAWNYFLALHNKKYTEEGKGITFKEMGKELTLLKRNEEYGWLNEANSQSLQASLMNLDTAFNRFFRTLGGFPNFKKKNQSQSFAVPQHFHIDGNRIYIPKFNKPLRIFEHRDYSGKERNLTISREPSGEYYVSILVLEPDIETQQKPVKAESTIGIDLGIKKFVTLSNGVQINKPNHIKRSEKKLVKAQRLLSRKGKGSKNRQKQRTKVARVQGHISNQRNDFLNKVSDVITKVYDTVVIEDLNVRGMLRNHHLARSISDAGWYTFTSMLKAKALKRGKNIIEIGRFDPSTKMCSHCGNIKDDLKLSERTYHCDVCGLTINRDLNASINIKRFGLISLALPTDSGEVTPVDSYTNTLKLLEREGIGASVLEEAGSPRL